MATIATYIKYELPGIPGKELRYCQYVLDFSVTNVTQDDILSIFGCPEDMIVVSAGYEILTQGTASATLDLGKAGGTELLSAINLNGSAGTKGSGAVADGGVLFKDTDTIDAQIAGATAIVGKIRVWWIAMDVAGIGNTNDRA